MNLAYNVIIYKYKISNLRIMGRQRKKVLMEGKEERRREEEENGSSKKEKEEKHEIPTMALNHVSRLCRSVKDSMEFYRKVLGFVIIERPQAFESFEGAWLFNYGVGIHLVESKDEHRLPSPKEALDPLDNHISFQCEDMEAIEQRLKDYNVKYIKRTVDDEENKTAIDQLFFKDPDGFMIEMCNCENLKLVPAGSVGDIKLPMDRHTPPLDLPNQDKGILKDPIPNSNQIKE